MLIRQWGFHGVVVVVPGKIDEIMYLGAYKVGICINGGDLYIQIFNIREKNAYMCLSNKA